MVNTRILEQRIGLRRGGPAAAGEDPQAPRALRHEPLLQGRIGVGAGKPVPAAVGLAAPRGRLARAGLEDTWAALPELAPSLEEAAARRGALPPFDRASPAGVALDQLRGQVLRIVSAQGLRRLGVAAPRRGAGASFLALGLAASIARLEYLRLALVDLDLARPSLDQHLGLAAPGPLDRVLRAELAPVELTVRVGENLALVLNSDPVPTAADLLLSPEAIRALRGLSDALQPDVMLYDLPPLLTDPAAQAALAQVDAVLLVADGTRTTARDITECERLLDGQAPLLGVVLNKSEDRPAPASRR